MTTFNNTANKVMPATNVASAAITCTVSVNNFMPHAAPDRRACQISGRQSLREKRERRERLPALPLVSQGRNRQLDNMAVGRVGRLVAWTAARGSPHSPIERGAPALLIPENSGAVLFARPVLNSFCSLPPQPHRRCASFLRNHRGVILSSRHGKAPVLLCAAWSDSHEGISAPQQARHAGNEKPAQWLRTAGCSSRDTRPASIWLGLSAVCQSEKSSSRATANASYSHTIIACQ